MTNDERNLKPECPIALSCAVAGFVIRISSFVIRVSHLRFLVASFASRMQWDHEPDNALGARLCEPQRVATAPSPAGHRPALRDGRFMESPLSLCARIGTMNPPLTPPRRGTETARTDACSPPGRGRGWVGSWRASPAFRRRIGSMNRFVLVLESKPTNRGRGRGRRRVPE